MRICVADITGSFEVIFQILGRKTEKLTLEKILSKQHLLKICCFWNCFFQCWLFPSKVLKYYFRVAGEVTYTNTHKLRQWIRVSFRFMMISVIRETMSWIPHINKTYWSTWHIKFKIRVNLPFAMSWFMRICVGDFTGSSEVIFQILGRKKKKKKVNIGKNNFKKTNIFFIQKRRRVETHLKKSTE